MQRAPPYLRAQQRSAIVERSGAGRACCCRRFVMSYRILALSIATLASLPVASAQAQSVYVAPGGVYVANGPVYVTPAPGYGAPAVVAPNANYLPPANYVPPAVVAPAPGYGPAGYGPARVYAAPPPAYYGDPGYAVRERGYAGPPVYAAEIAPRPPAPVPYNYNGNTNGNGRCVVSLGYGRWEYCD